MPTSLAAWHYDGQTAQRHRVTVALEGDTLLLIETSERVPLAELEPRGERDVAIFGRRLVDGWRLSFDAPLPEDWASAFPRQERHGGLIDRIGLAPALIGGAVLALLALVGLWRGADIVARLVPEAWEVALGDSLTGDFGAKACVTPEGQGALDALARRLVPDGRPVTVRVIDLDLVNAVALPGRRVLLFKGLVAEARSPDEVAGVLAHEIGHIENRDVMAGLIRDFGLSLLLGGADGGAMAQALVTNRYSRSAERGADRLAIADLARAGITPVATAGFFARLGKSEATFGRATQMLGYLSSHPLSAERQQAFARSVKPGHAYRPALDGAQWQAVRALCGGKTAPR